MVVARIDKEAKVMALQGHSDGVGLLPAGINKLTTCTMQGHVALPTAMRRSCTTMQSEHPHP